MSGPPVVTPPMTRMAMGAKSRRWRVVAIHPGPRRRGGAIGCARMPIGTAQRRNPRVDRRASRVDGRVQRAAPVSRSSAGRRPHTCAWPIDVRADTCVGRLVGAAEPIRASRVGTPYARARRVREHPTPGDTPSSRICSHSHRRVPDATRGDASRRPIWRVCPVRRRRSSGAAVRSRTALGRRPSDAVDTGGRTARSSVVTLLHPLGGTVSAPSAWHPHGAPCSAVPHHRILVAASDGVRLRTAAAAGPRASNRGAIPRRR
jgi:hypothetical protein